MGNEREICDYIGMLSPRAFINKHLWYDYLINKYIPGQGEEDMSAFIESGFIPQIYIEWKISKTKLGDIHGQ